MKHSIRFLLTLLLFTVDTGAALPRPSDRLKPVTFTVQDSSGNPLSDVFIEATRLGPGNAEASTDPDGTAVLQLTEGKSLSLYASKDGYYRTGGRIWSGGIHKGPNGKLVARVLPDSFTIELKAVKNPVPMRHHRIRERIPDSAQPVGYDLKTGDWVKPFGKGVVADLNFYCEKSEDEAAALKITFPNKGDGIQSFTAARPFSMEFGSDLAPPHRAPVSGYNRDLLLSRNPRKRDSYFTEDSQNYLFRTRTQLDAKGRILKACYGYIQGEINFDPRDPEGVQLQLSYFFNLDPDPEARSLEYNLHVPRSTRSSR